MKLAASIRLPVLLLALVHCCLGDEKAEFERLLKEATRPWGLESRLEPEWRKWTGLNTLSGFQFATENILETDDHSRRSLSLFVFRNTSVPKSELLTHLKERTNEASENGDMQKLERGFQLLYDLKGDPGVVTHFAKYFADDRIIETKPRQRESYFGEPLRVSDWACSWAKAWIQTNGMWDPADPDCHEDPGGFMMWEGRDNTKEAINRFLLKKGLIEKAEQPLRRKWEHDYSVATTPAPAKLATARPRKDPQLLPPPAPAEGSIPFYWPWLAAALVLLGWSVIRYLRRRSTG